MSFHDHEQRKQYKQTDTPTSSGRRQSNQLKAPKWLTPNSVGRVFSILIFIGLGFMIILNIQPWIAVAKNAADQIRIVPYFLLRWIPFAGDSLADGAEALIQPNLTALMGMTLWAVTQFIEVIPILTKFTNWQPPAWLRNKLTFLRAISYCIELIVCFLQYPPYKGGITAFWDDRGHWDFDLIDFPQMVLFVIALFGVEAAVWVALTMWQALNHAGANRRYGTDRE